MLLLAKNMLIPTHPRRKIKVDEEEGSGMILMADDIMAARRRTARLNTIPTK